MRRYWVVGGRYKDTSLDIPAEEAEEWFGPFATYAAAKEEWVRRASNTADESQVRYRIETRDPDGPPPCTD